MVERQLVTRAQQGERRAFDLLVSQIVDRLSMRVLIVDVNDDRIVIAATVRGAATLADTAGLREVLESLEIEVP